MKSLVVDTNRIIAALVKDGFSRMLLVSSPVTFFTIGFSKQEIMNHKEELMKRTDLDESAFDALLGTLYNKINLIADEAIQPHLEEAKQVMQHIDPDDVQFIAAALAIPCDGIWQMTSIFRNNIVSKCGQQKHYCKNFLLDIVKGFIRLFKKNRKIS